MSAKAAELLKALNSQVQHQPKQQQTLPPPTSNKFNSLQKQAQHDNAPSQLNSQIIKNGSPLKHSSLLKHRPFSADMIYEQGNEPPEYLVEILTKQLTEGIYQQISEAVQSSLRQRQKNTYDAFTKGENEYLQVLIQQTKNKQDSKLDFVTSLMSARQNKIEGALELGQMFIQHDRNLSNKKQLQRLQQMDHIRMIKIKDGELRSKLDILNEKMEKLGEFQKWDDDAAEKQLEEDIHKKIIESMDAGNYSLNSQKTKIAKDYVKYMQQQRRLLENRKKQRYAKYEEQQKQRQADLKEADQMRDMAKRQEILQRIQQKRRKREEEEKLEEEKQQKIHTFLAEYHKKYPLFKQKEKEFQQRILKPQQKYREQKLNQIRQYRKSVSMNQMKSHQQKYMVKRATEQQKRDQQFKMILKARKAQDQQRPYFKGSAHKRIFQMTKEEQQKSYSLREANRLKVHKMKQYGSIIFKEHKPVIDEQKRKQLVRAIEIDQLKKKHTKKVYRQVLDEATQEMQLKSFYQEIPERDLHLEGNRFLEQSKKRIKKKQKLSGSEQLLEKEKEQERQNQHVKITLLHSSKVSEKKGKSLWQLRAKQLEQMADRQVGDAKNFEYLKQNIQNLDNKAAQKEDLMKRLQLSMSQHLQEKGMLDNYYLESIKQKMKLLE